MADVFGSGPQDSWVTHGGGNLGRPNVDSSPARVAASFRQQEELEKRLGEIEAELSSLALPEDVRVRLLQVIRETDPSIWPLLLTQTYLFAQISRESYPPLPSPALQPAHLQSSTPTGMLSPSAPKPSSENPLSLRTRSAAAEGGPFANTPPDSPASHTSPLNSPELTATPSPDSPGFNPQPVLPAGYSVPISEGDAQLSGTYIPPQSSKIADPGTIKKTGSGLSRHDSLTNWRDYVGKATSLLETEAARSESPQEREAKLGRLRLLKLAAGQRDEALLVGEDGDSLGDFWAKALFGLWLLTDAEVLNNREVRLAEAADRLEEAALALRDRCPLVVRNLSFVTDIQSYGVFTPFERYDFHPGQRVLLYAEVENLRSIPTPNGYHSKSRAHIEIIDREGKRVAERSFAATEEYCRNRRRDFFLGFEFDLPSDLSPGQYTLELKVTDLHSGKVGRSVVEFTILGSRGGK